MKLEQTRSKVRTNQALVSLEFKYTSLLTVVHFRRPITVVTCTLVITHKHKAVPHCMY